MKNKEQSPIISVVQWIDYTLMAVLSFFCLVYISHAGRRFSEMNIQFSFLHFPIFVGEFLLLGCVAALLIRAVFLRVHLNRWKILIIAYVCFFLIKAAWGYGHYGPLAFRHAALFYYSLFAVVGYYCYRPEYFKWWMILIYLGVLHWLLFGGQFNDGWLMPRIFMGLLLAYKFPDRRVGVALAASVLILTPYQYFLNTSRAVILGNFASVSFLILMTGLIIAQKKRIFPLLCTIFFVLVLGIYIFYFSGNQYAKGLVSVDILKYVYHDTDMVIRQKKESFKPMEISNVGIYNPERPKPLINNVNTPVKDQPLFVKDQQLNQLLSQPSAPSKDSSVSILETASGPLVADDKPYLPEESDLDKHIRQMKIGNSVFRLLIWRDAKKDLLEQKPLFGFDFGKPFRSSSLETVRWGMNDWARDGWIAMHNSYLEIIYRAGIVGIGLIAGMLAVFGYCVGIFLRFRSVAGLLMCSGLMVPLVVAGFSVSLELPHMAIPIWTLFGLILAYAHRQLGIHQTTTGTRELCVS